MSSDIQNTVVLMCTMQAVGVQLKISILSNSLSKLRVLKMLHSRVCVVQCNSVGKFENSH